ncbi:PKD domain-containing protein [Cryobacterium melibiosiphilum]|uniref:PKD domain-containing protein n=1 Tax=Cryobacterium melibiosiphilum TaxID=995039 RepID=UPI0011C2216D|nr:PKD domain-containing protein [Cryobacterium melibiosiphilum]
MTCPPKTFANATNGTAQVGATATTPAVEATKTPETTVEVHTKLRVDPFVRWLLTDDLTLPLDQRPIKSIVKGPGLVEIRPDRFVLACMTGDPCDPNRPAVVVTPGIPAMRITDLATFTPDAPTQQMQPNGWMVKGLATNFVARASAHEQTGTLLGLPADVRFTPISYAWDYGDGTTGSSATGGATWQQLNMPEFSETATSHTYKPGEYTITPSVTYSAEYRYAGSDWLPVDGTITIPGAPTTATAWIVRTALVAKNCLDDPEGIGCYTKDDPIPNQ